MAWTNNRHLIFRVVFMYDPLNYYVKCSDLLHQIYIPEHTIKLGTKYYYKRRKTVRIGLNFPTKMITKESADTLNCSLTKGQA